MVTITLYAKQKKRQQMYRTEFWTLGEGEGGMFRENSIETCILSTVKQITSPGWIHDTSARAWCTGKTQRRGRWEGGSGWRILVNPWLIHVNVWQKPLQYCKVISLQLIKWKKKKHIGSISESSQYLVTEKIVSYQLLRELKIQTTPNTWNIILWKLFTVKEKFTN